MRTPILISLLLLLVGCGQKGFWCYQVIDTQYAPYNSKRIYHLPREAVFEPQFEVVVDACRAKGYINLLCAKLPCPCNVQVQIAKSAPLTVQGTVFAGEQRVLLPGQVTKTIIAALLMGKEVTLSLPDGQKTVLCPDNFQEAWSYYPPLICPPRFF